AALNVANEGRVRAKGKLELEPVRVNGDFTVENLRIQRFQPYVGPDRELAGGTLSATGRYDIALGGATPAIRLNAIDATLRDSRINTALGPDRWRAGTLSVRNAQVDVGARRITIAAVEGHDVAAAVQRSVNGDWHVSGLGSIAAQAAVEEAEATAEATPAAAPWQYDVHLISLAASTLQYEDRALPKPVKV